MDDIFHEAGDFLGSAFSLVVADAGERVMQRMLLIEIAKEWDER